MTIFKKILCQVILKLFLLDDGLFFLDIWVVPVQAYYKGKF